MKHVCSLVDNSVVEVSLDLAQDGLADLVGYVQLFLLSYTILLYSYRSTFQTVLWINYCLDV